MGIPTNKHNYGNEIPSDIAKALYIKLQENDLTKDQLLGIGVGAPGPINDRDGSVSVGVNIGWNKLSTKEVASRRVIFTGRH